MSTFHLALPKGLDARNTRNWIVVEQIRPGIYVRTNSVQRQRAADFQRIVDRDITESVTSLLKEVSILRGLHEKAKNT